MTPVSLNNFSIELGGRMLLAASNFEPVAGGSTVIIGPTGTGKSVFLKAVAGILPGGVFNFGGSMTVNGIAAYRSGDKTPHANWEQIMRSGLVFVPAESAQAMNPALTLEQNINLIAPGMMPVVARRLDQYFTLNLDAFARLYPDEVSGGELQRVTIMTLFSRPGRLILLDEPTVNLDRNLRRRFADFLNSEILNDRDKTILMASHDLDFIRSLRMDEAWSLGNGTLSRITTIPESEGFEKPERAFPVGGVLELEHVSQKYFKRGIFGERPFVAFSGLSVKFNRSIVYGITGPSGCGKSSMIKAILRLMDGTKGTISLDGIDLVALKPDERGWDPAPFRPFRRRIAVVQQDSRYSFFPDLKIASSFRHISPNGQDPSGLPSGLTENLARVGLTTAHLEAYPHSLSSGEMKRMDIARALTTQPEVLLLDEPFAHIDFETRSRVMHAISSYLATHETILIVVTHEDFDLRYFVDVNYDFPKIVEKTGA